MLNLATYLLLALAASSAEDLRSDYVCLLEEPNLNQCDSFCLNTLRPLLIEISQRQGQGITCDADNETKAKLANIEEQLKGLQAKMESQLQAKLEVNLLAVQRKLESLHRMVQTNMEQQMQAILNKMNDFQQSVIVKIPDRLQEKVPRDFVRIDTRYFRIVKEEVNWFTAKRRCIEMEGYLASFKNEKELKDITAKLEKGKPYWLGINDLEIRGHYVSVASRKPVSFLMWSKWQRIREPSEPCISLENGKMWHNNCDFLSYFICQADQEV